MIPQISPELITNRGEQIFYEAASRLPSAYTVYHSYEYIVDGGLVNHDAYYEADFVIVHPWLGYLTMTNFHDYLVKLLRTHGVPAVVPASQDEMIAFFQKELPEKAMDIIVELGEEEKFDALVVDEGQDFQDELYLLLLGLLARKLFALCFSPGRFSVHRRKQQLLKVLSALLRSPRKLILL